MAATKKTIYCTFPKEQIGEPILYTLGQRFRVVPNLRGATINDQMGIVFLELEEHTRPLGGGKETVEHTMSVFEFDERGKIVGFAVYFMVH